MAARRRKKRSKKTGRRKKARRRSTRRRTTHRRKAPRRKKAHRRKKARRRSAPFKGVFPFGKITRKRGSRGYNTMPDEVILKHARKLARHPRARKIYEDVLFGRAQ